MENIIYLSKTIFDWNYYSQWATILPDDKWERPYEMWEYSRALVDNATTEFELGDGIANLKRALNHRLQLIERSYNLRSIHPSWRNKGYLEILEDFGLVRPYLMKSLLTIRNDIEHNDAEPPEKERCKEFVDIVWYFLKSTDPLVQVLKSSNAYDLFDEEGYETHYGFNFELDYKDLNSIEISGWFYDELILNEPGDGFFAVEFNSLHTKKNWEGSLYHNEKLESDKWLNGKILNLDSETKKIIVSQVLSAF